MRHGMSRKVQHALGIVERERDQFADEVRRIITEPRREIDWSRVHYSGATS